MLWTSLLKKPNYNLSLYNNYFLLLDSTISIHLPRVLIILKSQSIIFFPSNEASHGTQNCFPIWAESFGLGLILFFGSEHDHESWKICPNVLPKKQRTQCSWWGYMPLFFITTILLKLGPTQPVWSVRP